MDGAALSEAVKSDLPSPKPNRRKRLALRFAVVVVAVAALGAAYWFTRPPELVWWRSPPLFGTGHKARLLIPGGWKINPKMTVTMTLNGERLNTFWLFPTDRRPRLLQRLFPAGEPRASLNVFGGKSSFLFFGRDEDNGPKLDQIDGTWVGQRTAVLEDEYIVADVQYWRTDKSTFDRTYKQICNSLRIE
jgi:hypothetical protein